MQVYIQSSAGKTFDFSDKGIEPYISQAHGAGDHLNPAAFPLFLDTLMYLIDGELTY